MPYPREAKRDDLFTRITISFVLIAVAMIFVSISSNGGIKYAAIKAFPKHSDGHVDEVEIATDGTMLAIHYSFTDAVSNTFTGSTYPNVYSKNKEYQSGDSIELVYSGLFPELNELRSKLETNAMDFYFMAAALSAMLLLTTFIFWNFGKLTKMRKEDRYY
ncbi:hypothetical protein [Marinobacterium jannaschii]|uniref:hypothetical protein n=1 Tax=Marinobacterium jannaschii TaxID=64970 RepID=UPI0004838595|nr:hypothetical protein [Marinobacterium jannaschii]